MPNARVIALAAGTAFKLNLSKHIAGVAPCLVHLIHPYNSEAPVKFKKGDLVRATQNSLCGSFIAGQTYTVDTVHPSGFVSIVMDSHGSRANGWNDKFFELVYDPNLLPIGECSGTFILPSDYPTDYDPVSDERQKRREAGQCEECGKLLPMSIHGLLECVDHPKPLPPDFKQ